MHKSGSSAGLQKGQLMLFFKKKFECLSEWNCVLFLVHILQVGFPMLQIVHSLGLRGKLKLLLHGIVVWKYQNHHNKTLPYLKKTNIITMPATKLQSNYNIPTSQGASRRRWHREGPESGKDGWRQLPGGAAWAAPGHTCPFRGLLGLQARAQGGATGRSWSSKTARS